MKRYGADKLCRVLNDWGITCRTTINEKWVTDITYIHVLKKGWIYLASVMDLNNRKIIGYSYGKNMTAELALQAEKNATLNTDNLNVIILHSDSGSQYTSDHFENYLSKWYEAFF